MEVWQLPSGQWLGTSLRLKQRCCRSMVFRGYHPTITGYGIITPPFVSACARPPAPHYNWYTAMQSPRRDTPYANNSVQKGRRVALCKLGGENCASRALHTRWRGLGSAGYPFEIVCCAFNGRRTYCEHATIKLANQHASEHLGKPNKSAKGSLHVVSGRGRKVP